MKKAESPQLTPEESDRIIEMAWEDRTPFDAIFRQFGLNEQAVIRLMRGELQEGSFKRWRKRVQGRKTKHYATSSSDMNRFHCARQRSISQNAISKRRSKR
ncbi:MAG: TIGR03643 family protein [Lunatimonas sp.]|uniref:TIGR03643 family protein n=1 Tax=Lunatimonas sp. TaxID=2060141 RepID=UPI00263AAEA7|nr:TIGR03643 family protein [Lunatimonas sp.]MCC5938609.1 TIGR03643 family protein [Lunatimonas sp.]